MLMRDHTLMCGCLAVFSELNRARFCVPLDTKQVTLETFFPAKLLAGAGFRGGANWAVAQGLHN